MSELARYHCPSCDHHCLGYSKNEEIAVICPACGGEMVKEKQDAG